MFSGVRYYWVEPDPIDRRKPEKNRIWPWKEMNVGDYVLLLDGEHDHLFNTATVSAYQYGHRHGETYRSGRFNDRQGMSGIAIWRQS
jgi:hypothetical protein